MTVEVITLDAQIACVEREIKQRERVYARLVDQGKMTFTKAASEIGTMKAVLGSLQGLKQKELLF